MWNCIFNTNYYEMVVISLDQRIRCVPQQCNIISKKQDTEIISDKKN